MQLWNQVAIVGVGLIGGSIGMALRKRRLARRVVGIGRRQASLNKARRAGAVDGTTTDLARGVADAELIVVCTPVENIVGHVRAAADACPEGALITDAGSTKGAIVERLDGQLPRQVRFVGSHPLAGSEKTGAEHARADLFEGRVAVVTPTRRTAATDYTAIEKFWSSLGARVIRKSPQAHDAALARTSHMPHAVASALAAATSGKDLPLVAGGWLSTTRIAAADEKLWRQILLDNRDNTLAALDDFEQALAQLRKAIEQNDRPHLERLWRKGRRKHEKGQAAGGGDAGDGE